MSKPNPICEVCTGWLEEVKNGTWLRCRSCGFMKRRVKPKVTPLPKG